jgi:hypothetical protein
VFSWAMPDGSCDEGCVFRVRSSEDASSVCDRFSQEGNVRFSTAWSAVQTSAELSVLIYDVFISVWPSRAGALRAHIHIGRVGEGGR